MLKSPLKSPSLWNRDFLLLWQGSAVSALGDQAYSIAIMLWAKQATESGTIVGLVMFAGGITGLLMPLGGVLADRLPRVRMLVLLDCLSGSCVLVLATLFATLPNNHWALIPIILAINFIRGICTALFHPVSSALMPDLVADESLTSANSSLQSADRTMALFGQSIGGILFRLLGTPLLLFVDGFSFLLSALSEAFIREPPRTELLAEKKGLHLFRDLRDGLQYTGRVRGFRLYLLGATSTNFFMAALFVSLPFFVEDVLHASVDWYGYLLGAMGLGAVIGATIARRFSVPGPHRGYLHLFCLVCLSGNMLPLSLVRSPWVAAVVLSFSWMCIGFHQVILATLVQKRTPPELRGRVFSLLTMIRSGLTPLGIACFGVLIDQLSGPVTNILFWAGSAGLAIALHNVLRRDYRWFFMGNDSVVDWTTRK